MKNKITASILINLFGFKSSNTYNEWNKSDKRFVLKLIQKYFTNEDLTEFMIDNKISKMDSLIKSGDIANHIYYEIENNCISMIKEKDKFMYSFLKFISTIDISKYDDLSEISIKDFTTKKNKVFIQIQTDYTKYLISIDSKEYIKHTEALVKYFNELSSDVYRYIFIKDVIWGLKPDERNNSKVIK